MRNISLLLVSAVSILGVTHIPLAQAQSGSRPGTKFTATLKFDVAADEDTQLVVLDVLIPQTLIGRQRIGDLVYSQTPTQVFDKDGQRYAQFLIRQFPAEVKIDIPAEIFRYDLATARTANQAPTESKHSLQQWLIYEQYLEKDSAIVLDAAKGLTAANDEATVRATFEYVTKTLKRRAFDERDFGGARALHERWGDCSEFADVLVTLCRAQGVPARVCEGYLLETSTDTQKHGWAEVYLEKHGWVPFDPFFAFLKRRTTFTEMRPIYLYLDFQRRNGVLNQKHYFAFRFEGTGKVTVKDSFRFQK